MSLSRRRIALPLSLLLGLTFLAACTNPPADPNCQSGVGQLFLQNNSSEPVTISISDANGALPTFIIAGSGGKRDEDAPVGTAHLSAVGTVSHTTLLQGNFAVKCDAPTIITILDIPHFSLNVEATGTGQGIVSSTPAGISCGSMCSGSFPPDAQVTLNAVPTANSTFTSWGGACASATTATCVVKMSQAQDVTAQFDSANPTQTYPAAHAALPRLIDSGGHVLAHPVFTSITFPGDALASSLDQFASQIGASSFWTAMSEYAAGAATAATPVHVTSAPPTTITDDGIQAWLVSMLDGTHPEFGTPTGNSLYIINYPASTSVTLQGLTSCTDFDGYHSEVQLGNGQQVSYAVIVRCAPASGQSQLDQLTSTTSHEMAEAASDALPFTDTGIYGVIASQHIWDTMSFGAETSDMCQRYGESYYTPADLSYQVARFWSNAAAAASANPCAPNSAVYFNSAPSADDAVKYSADGALTSTRGVLIPLGQSKTIPIALFSNAPTSGPWQLSAVEEDNTVSNLNFAFDKTSGQNGDIVELTITAKSVNSKYKGELFWIRSTLGAVSHYWPVLVSQTVGNPTAQPSSPPSPLSRHGRLRVYKRPKHKHVQGDGDSDSKIGMTILD